jgi:SAM-dependent methyltransferase
MRPPEAVIWHDAECGWYGADLRLWRELAQATGGPVLDVGAGTGRVALDLARHGHEVTALDRDEELLAELRRRAGDLPIVTVKADARDFTVDGRFGLVIIPMQTIQILGGDRGRAQFLRRAREHLRPGGLLAAAVTAQLESFDEGDGTELPVPDVSEHEGWVYASQPVAVRHDGPDTIIERIRHTIAPDGERTAEQDVIRLEGVHPERLEFVAGALGYEVMPPRVVEATLEHVASTVVFLRALPLGGPQDHAG